MKPMKRKSSENITSDPTSNKRLRIDTKDKSGGNKSQKESDKENSRPRKTHKTSTTLVAQPSVLTKEQPAFPRGGAGLLTPLEKKQIQAKATRDAVEEHKGSKNLFGSSEAFDAASTIDDLLRDENGLSQKPAKKSKNKKHVKPGAVEKGGVRIESLSYKRVSEGCLILGQISRVNARDLTMSLPNNLTGTVPLTSISAGLTEKIESLLVEEAGDIGKTQDENEDLDLQTYFRVGQYLRVCVTSLSTESSGRNSRGQKKIELSIEPESTNAGLDPSNVVTGCVLQASVISIEDHGVVVDLGLKGGKTRGFIPEKELGEHSTLSSIKIGAVLFCLVSEVTSTGRMIKLSANELKLGNIKQAVLKNAPVIDSFLPGTVVEILLTEVVSTGLIGKVMGMLDVTADLLHSGAYNSAEDLQSRFSIGKKIKGRLLCNFPLSDSKKVGFSVLENVMSFEQDDYVSEATSSPSISTIIPNAEVIKVEPRLGLYLQLGSTAQGFAHLSRLADNKVDSISESSGPFKIGTKHNARVLEYNPIDHLYLVSLQPKVLQQPFIRFEDVPVGEKVTGKIEKVLIGENGVKGLLINLTEGVTGLVPQMHFSDIALQHPEKKFREGATVTGRILSTDLLKQQLRMTLKKTLVNSDQKLWKAYTDITIGDASPGTLVKVEPYGAIVQFYNFVKGFLPVSEMSEAYIKDATQHFRVGQVITVNAISVTPEMKRLTLSCREPSASNQSVETTLGSLSPGVLISGTVFEKSEDDLLMRLDTSGVIARLPLDHISDGSLRKRQSALNKVRVGQVLQDVMILEVQAKRRMVLLSNRSSLIRALKDGSLLKSFADLEEGMTVNGLVSNVTTDGIFVSFAGGISGLVPKSQAPIEVEGSVDFGVTVLQPITARVTSIDYRGTVPRFWLTMREETGIGAQGSSKPPRASSESTKLVDPVDDTFETTEDFQVGKITKARIVSVKETQINVELAKDVHGRIDVSAVFDDWEAIKDRKRPLRMFSAKQIVEVKVLGAHDARNHRFLPLTHRSSRVPVLELSVKPSDITNPKLDNVKLENIKLASSWLAFVNNVGEDCLWVNISPSVRGRIRSVDVSDDLSHAGDLEGNFPIGSALKVHVVSVDVSKNHLDLSARQSDPAALVSLKDIVKGTILPGRITRVSDRQLLVQLSDTVVGAVSLIDMADDYAQVDPTKYQKNDVIRAYVVDVSVPNKKVSLSVRPSKVLSSSMTVTDPEVTSVQELNVNDICRGFISNVADQGLFVTLGHNVTAHVRVTNLSDSYLKEWKDLFQRDQLVRGKIVSVEKSTGYVQLSLKESVLNAHYKPPLTFTDVHAGDIVTGKVVKVETFGVFILVDNSQNVRGLCHRSEIADQRIEDASKIFSVGDVVKAKVLKVELDKRRVNFSMKASHFTRDLENDMELDSDGVENTEIGGTALNVDSKSDENSENAERENKDGMEPNDAVSDYETPLDEDSDLDPVTELKEDIKSTTGLSVGGFDWYGMSIDSNGATKRLSNASDTEDEKTTAKPKKKKRRAEIQVDRTGDLDANGPQSADDFERLLLGDPDSSLLWLQYMAFHLELGDVDQARQIGEQAIKSIGLTQEPEKLNVWIALLNLENAYGDDGSIEGVFQRACEYNDPQDVHTRLTSIYIQSGKQEKADELFQAMLKKFGRLDPKIWINYASYLFDSVGDADKGRALLSRALQTLPQFTHFDITSKFAQLEFKSSAGLPERGRTIFEGLLSSFPKRVDLFNVLLDLETKLGDKEQVRGLFKRIFAGKVKPKQARFFFKRWLAFEEKEGDERSVDTVKVRAADWVKSQASSEKS